MTRDYNKQRRDDSRPSFRHQPPTNRYGEERSPRPGRRLSREIVDRAWEQGAQPQHADYRSRNGGQGARNNRSNYQQSEHRSPYQNNGGNRQNHSQRPKPYGPNTGYNQGNPRRNHSGAQGYQDSHQQAPRPGRHSFEQERPPYERQSHNGSRPHQSYRSSPQRYNDQPSGRQQRPRSPERFEGDYERFDSHDDVSSPSRQRPERKRQQPNRNYHPAQASQEKELHVTRLPDGRVLKGSRPVQRKKAHFWTEITDDAENLIQHIHTPLSTDEDQRQAPDAPLPGRQEQEKKPPSARKARTPRNAEEKEKKQNQNADGFKPAPRGFKRPAS
jgi:hypothetical protein